MSVIKKPPGSIHRIREFELEKIHLSDEFDILQIVGEGWFGKILLVEHRATDTEMVLKALPKPYVSLRDFYREFHYGLHLGIHKNIVTTYDVAFETAGFYVFTQEYAPLGDLTSNVSESGIGELHSKRVAKQIASALDYMHSKEIVHRDVKLDNVLIYKSDFSRVKLCDFGESYKSETIVERRNEWLPYSPPEVLQIKTEGTYKADPSHDVWQFGIVIFVCLTGCLPWQKAGSDDPRYVRYIAWQATSMVLPLRRTPKLFKLLSSKGSRMFRKFLEPKSERRPKNLADLSKFMDDRWLAKGAEKDMAENEQDELCPSMYSFHSSPEEKNKLLSTLAEYGIETTVDRVAKKNRIRDWIESSVITEEDEEDDSGTATPSSSVSREPIPGHISAVRAEEEKQKKINTTLKDAANKHFDPRTGVVQSGPSEMGAIAKSDSLISMHNGKDGSFDSGSIVTLASRNDLISSEGQSYHSDLNLSMIGHTPNMAESMVNANHQNISVETNSNNHRSYYYGNNGIKQSNAISSPNVYNESTAKYNFGNSLTAAGALTNQLNLQMKSADNINQWHSSIALNQNNSSYYNNNSLNNTKFNNSNSNGKSNFNSQINRLPLTSFKSIATISVPSEAGETEISTVPNSLRQHILSRQSQLNKDSGYGSFDSKMKQQYYSQSSNQIPQSPILAKKFQEDNNESSYQNLSMTKKNPRLNPVKSHDQAIQTEIQQGTMKDTPYDRIRVKKIK